MRGTFNWLEIRIVKHGGVQKNFSICMILLELFLLLSLVAFATLLLARAIACEGRRRDKVPLGLGRPFLGFK